MPVNISEQETQIMLISYCDWRGVPVFHVPNGGSRNAREAAILKAQGVRAGVPDLCFPAARHGYNGLFVELKVGKNKPTPQQREWLKLLNQNGYHAVAACGFDQARAVIDAYFDFV